MNCLLKKKLTIVVISPKELLGHVFHNIKAPFCCPPGVCSNIIHLDQKKLQFYTGNYDMFVQTRCELLENQMKQYKWEQDQIANMKVSWGLWYRG